MSFELMGKGGPVGFDSAITRLPDESWTWRATVFSEVAGAPDVFAQSHGAAVRSCQDAVAGMLEALLRTFPGATRAAIKRAEVSQ